LAQQLAASQQHSQQLEQQLQESAGQTGRMEQQLSELDEVVNELSEQQHQEAQLRAEYEAMAEQALAASYRAKGLVYAQGIKTMVAEYYMMSGRYPRSNTSLGIQRPEAYANDTVRAITVSKGGRISIVYTEKAGQAGGAIHLTPKEVNGLLEWRCSSWDSEDIRDTMPTCHYGGLAVVHDKNMTAYVKCE
jgi:TolA-binding protein